MRISSSRLVLGCVAALAFAAADTRAAPFAVEFTDCVESIGVGLAPTANVLAITPAGFIPVGIGGAVTPVVVRTASCAGIAVDGSKPKPGSVVQIGAVIVPPQPGADIDNYTFWYYTTHAKLAHRLQDAGIDAQHVANLDYDLASDKPGVPNNLTVTVRRPGDPRFAIAGTVVPSGASAGTFRAAWWQQTAAGDVRMDTHVPAIDIGTAALVLTTGTGNELSNLIGGTTLAFPLVQQFNVFTGAHMSVGVAP